MRALVILVLSLSAACRAEPAAEADPAANVAVPAEAQAPEVAHPDKLPDPPPPPPPPAPLPGLMPLDEAEVRAELGSGASCALSDGGRLLMVAMLGDAVVRHRGRIVHLKPEAKNWNALAEGGRFAAGELAVEIDAGAEVARQEEVIERDASVSVIRAGRGFSVSHGPRWACGS